MIRRLIFLAFAALASISGAPVRAEQASITMPLSNPNPGQPFTLQQFDTIYLNPALVSITGCFSGSTTPTSPVTYQCWADTSSSPTAVKIYDGAQWVIVYYVDTSAHTIISSGLISPAQLPAFTGGDCTTTAGSVVLNCSPLLAKSNTWTNQQAYRFSYPGLNTNLDFIRVSVGGLNQAWEFPNLPGTPHTNYSTASFVAALVIPAGSYSGDATWPDFASASYALTYNTSKTAMANFAMAGVGVAGGHVGGYNSVITNCELAKPSCTNGGGYDAPTLIGNESDINMNLLPGNVAPTSGSITGYRVALQATSSAMTNITGSAYDAVSISTGKIPTVYNSQNGAATVFAASGAQGTTASSDGQISVFSAINSSSATISATMQFRSDGNFYVINGVSGMTWDWANSYPQVTEALSVNGPAGFRISNASAGASSSANYLAQTGTSGASMSLGVVDNGGSPYALLAYGAAINTYTLQLNGANTFVATRGGGLQIGAPTGGDCGAGCLNAAGLRVNNAVVATLAGTNTWTGVNSFTNSTASSSKTTGAVVVTGGVGIGGALYANQVGSATSMQVASGAGLGTGGYYIAGNAVLYTASGYSFLGDGAGAGVGQFKSTDSYFNTAFVQIRSADTLTNYAKIDSTGINVQTGVFQLNGTSGITKACSVVPTAITFKGGIVTSITGGTCV